MEVTGLLEGHAILAELAVLVAEPVGFGSELTGLAAKSAGVVAGIVV